MTIAASKSVLTPSVRIHYLEYGSPTGIPVICLHGFPDAPVAYEEVISLLKDEQATHRFLVPYLRGFGETEVLNPNLIAGQEAALGDDLLGFADALGLETFHLVGHDWGARTAYAAATFAPERLRSLFTMATPYVMFGGRDYPPDQVRGNWYQWYFQLEQGNKVMRTNAVAFCHELWESWSPTWGFSKREFAQAAEAWANPQFADIVIHYYRTRWGGALSRPGYAALQAQLAAKPKITVPSVYIQGGADACGVPACSEDQDGWFTAGYERVLLKGVGHFPHREDPKAVAKLLRRQLGK
jgi:pimeloyl-ACP methyl ester carboxylesterase